MSTDQTGHNLDTLFNPRSIAIIGINNAPSDAGRLVLKNIISGSYDGEIFLVHPTETMIDDRPVYAEYRDLQVVPDLAIVVLPAEYVIAEVAMIAESGTKHVIIYSSGFAEVGGIGEEMEEALLDIAEEKGVNILGPNCLGFVSSGSGLNATCSPVTKTPGNLRFLSQSGAIFAGVFDWSLGTGVGFDDVVSLGNKVSVDENDVLEYWLSRPFGVKEESALLDQGLSPYHPVGMYLESIVDGVELMDLIHHTSRRHPVFVLRPGKSAAARKGMKLHTGAIVGDDMITRAALLKAGAVQVSGMEDLFDLCRVFSWERAPEGPRVAIISNDGGPAIISADILLEEGLELAELDEKTRARLEALLPRTQQVTNLIDVGGAALAERYSEAIETVIMKSDVDALIVILSPRVMSEIEETAEVIETLSRRYQKTILCSFVGGRAISYGEDILNFYHVPTFRFPERAVRALGAMWRWNAWRRAAPEVPEEIPTLNLSESNRTNITEILRDVDHGQHGVLQSVDMFEIFDIIGIPVPPSAHADTLKEAQEFVKKYGYPVVLKFAGPYIPHKSAQGLVEMGIRDEDALQNLHHALKDRSKKLHPVELEDAGIDIQKEIEGGVEVFVGIKFDEEFGNTLVLSRGLSDEEREKHAEVIPLPVSQEEIRDMLESLDLSSALSAAGGVALLDIIVRLSALAEDVPHFEELEINPVIVTEDAAWAVDGKGLIEKLEEVEPI